MRWLLALFAMAALAQETVTVRVGSAAPEGVFWVDGVRYVGSAAFAWPAGTKHILEAGALQAGPSLGVRHRFGGWHAAHGPLASESPRVAVTADPALPWFEARVQTEFALSLSFNRCVDGACASPGRVYVNRIPYTENTDVWLRARTEVTLEAEANPGYVFTGWAWGGTVARFVLERPMVASGSFQTARRIELASEPSGLVLLADRSPLRAPAALDWAYGTVHGLEPVSPQLDKQGKPWIFRSWADGADRVRRYRVEPGSIPATLTAVFEPGAAVTLLTSPPGLRLRVDGASTAPPYNFIWALNERHAVAAPERQADARGVPYRFREWAHGGAAEQSIAVTGDTRFTAVYETLGALTLESPVAVAVDGRECPSPCRLEGALGSEVRLEAPASAPLGDSTRLEFTGWQDGGARIRTATLGAPRTLTALYTSAHRITAAALPPEGAAFRFTPLSPDGFYREGSEVTAAAIENPGFRFRKWQGGGGNPLRVVADAPRTLVAVLDAAPHISPTGVRNAAPGAPEGPVAAGSLISIFGRNLAPETASGLGQALGGVSVTVDGAPLPLLFVSPEQINAQLPAALEPGRHTLRIPPDVAVPFESVGAAPGLFLAKASGAAWGTGLGLCDPPPLDGFPAAAACPLAGAVEVDAGDGWQPALWAGAVPGQIGLAEVHFAVPPGATQVRVRAGGRESNAVPLEP
ncbi:MAG: IPT/TIG domain-containing protein [Bryobacteraceae bacterium]